MAIRFPQAGSKKIVPSPNAYDQTYYSVGRSGSKWVFGSEPLGGKKNANSTISPGPNTYTLKS